MIMKLKNQHGFVSTCGASGLSVEVHFKDTTRGNIDPVIKCKIFGLGMECAYHKTPLKHVPFLS